LPSGYPERPRIIRGDNASAAIVKLVDDYEKRSERR
jgi:hypothetical protein